MSKLVLITLPIGNSEDITKRALEILKEEDHFLAEDTRNLSKLLNHYGIDSKSKNIDSFHDHSEDKIVKIVDRIKRGQKLCIVSDAGSPVISDPAFPLIRACLKDDVKIETCSGISAVTCALELSGLPPHPFHFHDFLAKDSKGRKDYIGEQLSNVGTHIFFESPYRMEESLEILSALHPEGEVAVARELTKTYESVYRFKAGDFKNQNINYKGEFVLLFHVSKDQVPTKEAHQKLKDLANQYLREKRSTKNLSKLLAEILEERSSDIYSELNQ